VVRSSPTYIGAEIGWCEELQPSEKLDHELPAPAPAPAPSAASIKLLKRDNPAIVSLPSSIRIARRPRIASDRKSPSA
jgi:hypothetical protein